jgi:hypothetical protein
MTDEEIKGEEITEQVVEILRETADGLESGQATLEEVSYALCLANRPHDLHIKWWDDE